MNDERVADAEAAGCEGGTDLAMIAASVNAALGRAGLLLMLAACVIGALTVLVGVRRGDQRLLRQGARYAWMALGGIVLAVVMMQRALITRDFSMAYIQQVGSADTPRALQHRRDVVGARGVDPALGADPRWLHGGRRVAVPPAHERRPRRVGARRDVHDRRLLRRAQLRPGRPVRCGCHRCDRRGPARTRCCRTTSWCCSTRRSCTSATSDSPCRSPSPSPRSSPAGSARAG